MVKNGIIYNLDFINNIENINTSSWQLKCLNNFKNILKDKNFPCVFAIKAVYNQTIKLLFVENACEIISGLIEYTQFIKNTPYNKRILCPLLVTFKDEHISSIKEAHDKAWNMLQFLHDNDPQEWPHHITMNMQDSGWTFCFNGVELFINISSIYHQNMKSRNLGNKLNFVVNPRKIFDIVANGNEVSGMKMRQMIRNRVKSYNTGLTALSLGSFGDESNFEWKQYQLTETGNPIETCPLKIGTKDD